jgi:hypothetical protein
VQVWRKEHSDYSRKFRSTSKGALQENWASKTARKIRVGHNPPHARTSPLQEVCRQELPLLVGLIARIEHCALQEDMAIRIQQMVMEGQCILDRFSSNHLGEPRRGYRQLELLVT